MFAIKPACVTSANEKLRPIRIWPRVGHRKHAESRVPQLKIFIRKAFTVDRLPASSVPHGDIAALTHEALDNTMELGPFIVKRFTPKSHTLLTSAQGSEVLCGFRNDIWPQLHDDAPSGYEAHSHIEEDT